MAGVCTYNSKQRNGLDGRGGSPACQRCHRQHRAEFCRVQDWVSSLFFRFFLNPFLCSKFLHPRIVVYHISQGGVKERATNSRLIDLIEECIDETDFISGTGH